MVGLLYRIVPFLKAILEDPNTFAIVTIAGERL